MMHIPNKKMEASVEELRRGVVVVEDLPSGQSSHWHIFSPETYGLGVGIMTAAHAGHVVDGSLLLSELCTYTQTCFTGDAGSRFP